jgi:hypothetical protein
MTDPERIARSLLDQLQADISDRDKLLELFSDVVVLFGDDIENFSRDETIAYLTEVAAHGAEIKWEWDRVEVVASEPGSLSFAAAGTIGFYDAAGTLTGGDGPFRLTCVAVEADDRWRLKHFHGSRRKD